MAVADNTPPAAARSGEEVFNAACAACHGTGVMNAPKLEKAAWEPRVAKGLDGLVHSAINGLNAMPPRGGNPAITDEEITNDVTYMTTQAGFDLAAGTAPAAGAEQQAAASAAAATEPAAPETPAAETQQVSAPQQAAAPEAPVAPEAPQAPAAPEAPTASEAPATPVTHLSGNDGETVYRSICFSCHDVGIANSPMLGDKNAWAARMANGVDSLYASTINGKGVMPARGGNPALTDDNLKAAVDWMLAQAGGMETAQAAPTQEPAPATEQAAPAQEAAPAAEQAAPAIDGKAIYQGLCFSCHDNGVANAPKPGDKAAWEPRIAKGMDALLNSVLNGLNAMPPKGGNPALSDDEIKAAVDWMVSQ
ncbi:MAG: c-type cytochrome [Thiolinea sp.]